MTAVKFCGLTRAEDVRLACTLGAAAVGFVLWPESPRYVDTRALPSLVGLVAAPALPVGVFVDPTDDEVRRAVEAGIRIVQVHAARREPRHREVETWWASNVEADLSTVPAGMTLLLDAHDPVKHGGTGQTVDWARAASVAAERRVWLAGGLTPANVAAAIARVRPHGVDVASGVEDRPGIKNEQAMRAFMAAVGEADR